jgi:hypothetical protein
VVTGNFLACPQSTSRRKLLSGGRDVLPSDEHTPLRAGREPVRTWLGRLLARDGGAAGRPATVRTEKYWTRAQAAFASGWAR